MKRYLFLLIVIALCFSLTGCATTRQQLGYKVEGKEYKTFEELDDDKALKMVVMIYNVNTNSQEEIAAKNIALTKYMRILKGRNSKYLKESGVFDLGYEKIYLNKWHDEDLRRVFKYLQSQPEKYDFETTAELTEQQNTRRIVYLTAMVSIAEEVKKRDNSRYAMDVFGNMLGVAIAVAVSLI